MNIEELKEECDDLGANIEALIVKFTKTTGLSPEIDIFKSREFGRDQLQVRVRVSI